MLLDQHVFCGVGNVYRCEVLWACELSPYAPMGELSESRRHGLVSVAARLLRANLDTAEPRSPSPGVPGGLAVYGRSGQRCFRCSETMRARRAGELNRTPVLVPGMPDPARSPQRPGEDSGQMDRPRRRAVRSKNAPGADRRERPATGGQGTAGRREVRGGFTADCGARDNRRGACCIRCGRDFCYSVAMACRTFMLDALYEGKGGEEAGDDGADEG